MIIHVGEFNLALAVLILDPLTLVPFVSRRSPDHIAPQRPSHTPAVCDPAVSPSPSRAKVKEKIIFTPSFFL